MTEKKKDIMDLQEARARVAAAKQHLNNCEAAAYEKRMGAPVKRADLDVAITELRQLIEALRKELEAKIAEKADLRPSPWGERDYIRW